MTRLALVALLLLAPLAGPSAAAASSPQPNVVLILADDLGYGSLGCYGSRDFKTPNIDRLAADGVRLTDFHANGVLCSPTRAALMTGRYQQRCAWVADAELSPVFQAQRRENPKQRWAWGIAPTEITIPQLLRRAGYRTALVGKWHLGYDVAFHPMNYGFDEFRGFVGGNVDYHTHVAGYGTKAVDWWTDEQLRNEPGYTTDLLAQHAAAFIERNRGRPFFLSLAHAAPHAPWQGRDARIERPAAETYREMVAVLDESVGVVLEALHMHRLESTTLVIFCSDNGPAAPPGIAAGGPLQGKKGSVLEGGHRVPFIARWPGVIPAGTTSPAVVMTMDLLPTVARLAAAALPAGHAVDGADVLPVLTGETSMPERTLHWRSGNAWAVRQGGWKLSGTGGRATTLVNLESDLAERENLIDTVPDRASTLMELHARWTADVGGR